jgi:hypothetical protein
MPSCRYSILAGVVLLAAGCDVGHVSAPLDSSSVSAGAPAPVFAGRSESSGAPKVIAGSHRTDVAAPSSRSLQRQTIAFDDIKFDITQDQPFLASMVPERSRALVGQPILIRGYVNPYYCVSHTGITRFLLVRDNGTCCFGPAPLLCDCILVTMEDGKSIDFPGNTPITVSGTFRLEDVRFEEEGNPLAIYQMSGEFVE